MSSAPRRMLVLFVIGCGLVACGNGNEPSGSTGTTDLPSDGAPTGTGPASGTGEPTTASEPTTGEPTTGGSAIGKEVCDRYIQCVAVTVPTALPDAQAGFGDDSTCWSGDADDAALCVTACQTALDQSHEAFPAEEKCHACVTDSVCMTGERCLKGGCTLDDCGDGVVDADEVCDDADGCDLDCQGPGECNPVSGHGCEDGEYCYLLEQRSYVAQCDGDIGGAALGEGCGDPDPMVPFDTIQCAAGLACVLEARLGVSCDLEGCCVPLCNTGAASSCPMDLQCVAYGSVFDGPNDEPLEPGLESWLGVCAP